MKKILIVFCCVCVFLEFYESGINTMKKFKANEVLKIRPFYRQNSFEKLKEKLKRLIREIIGAKVKLVMKGSSLSTLLKPHQMIHK